MDPLYQIIGRLQEVATQRNWVQIQSPKNLTDAAELFGRIHWQKDAAASLPADRTRGSLKKYTEYNT
jgi:hypothetical protein